MEEKISFCGFRCELCPAYKDNITCDEDRKIVSDGWFKHYGFRIPPEDIYCDGCLADDSSNPRRIDSECNVRSCAMRRGLPNCAHCEDFICEKLSERIVDPKEVAKRVGGFIAPEDYEKFVKPYENKSRLEEIRSGL